MIEKVEDACLFVKQHHFRSDKCTSEFLQNLKILSKVKCLPSISSKLGIVTTLQNVKSGEELSTST
jgi:hypothetical protein